MDNITDEILSRIEKLASYFFTTNDIAIYCGLDIEFFLDELNDNQSKIYQSYHKGRINRTMEIRKNEIKMAVLGSPMAQAQVRRYIEKQKQSESN